MDPPVVRSPLVKSPVVKSFAFMLFHVPGLVRYGVLPGREVARTPEWGERLSSALRSHADVVAYPPHQALIGNVRPEDLEGIARPWYEQLVPDAAASGALGDVLSEELFLAALKVVDEQRLVLLDEAFAQALAGPVAGHPLFTEDDLARIGPGVAADAVAEAVERGGVALTCGLSAHGEGRVVGCLRRIDDSDAALAPETLLENLAAKATATLALRRAVSAPGVDADAIEYLLDCGEEAVGDGYQRGLGGMAKSVGALAGCPRAGGADVKAACAAPTHAVVLGASLVQSGLCSDVAVIGGGSMPKLGMNAPAQLERGSVILEDVLAAVAVVIGEDDGVSPQVRLDMAGWHRSGDSSAPQHLAESMIAAPLERAGKRITDIDRYALELQNPEILGDAGSRDSALTNYRILARLAQQRGEISGAEAREQFVRERGLPGFAPTQGHLASAIAYLGHANEAILRDEVSSVMLAAKGSLFLGRMTTQSDGCSFVLQRNDGLAP
jgi:betaine reductase